VNGPLARLAGSKRQRSPRGFMGALETSADAFRALLARDEGGGGAGESALSLLSWPASPSIRPGQLEVGSSPLAAEWKWDGIPPGS